MYVPEPFFILLVLLAMLGIWDVVTFVAKAAFGSDDHESPGAEEEA